MSEDVREIIGNTTATPNPRPDWKQTDETKADYIKNKPENLATTEYVDDKIKKELQSLKMTPVDITDKCYAGEYGVTYRVVFGEEYRTTEKYQYLIDNISDYLGDDYNNPFNDERVDIAIQEVTFSSVDATTPSIAYYSIPTKPDDNGICEFELAVPQHVDERDHNSLLWNSVEGLTVYKLVESEPGNVSVDLSNYYTKPEIDAKFGDIDAALDRIIEIQNELLGVSE